MDEQSADFKPELTEFKALCRRTLEALLEADRQGRTIDSPALGPVLEAEPQDTFARWGNTREEIFEYVLEELYGSGYITGRPYEAEGTFSQEYANLAPRAQGRTLARGNPRPELKELNRSCSSLHSTKTWESYGPRLWRRAGPLRRPR